MTRDRFYGPKLFLGRVERRNERIQIGDFARQGVDVNHERIQTRLLVRDARQPRAPVMQRRRRRRLHRTAGGRVQFFRHFAPQPQQHFVGLVVLAFNWQLGHSAVNVEINAISWTLACGGFFCNVQQCVGGVRAKAVNCQLSTDLLTPTQRIFRPVRVVRCPAPAPTACFVPCIVDRRSVHIHRSDIQCDLQHDVRQRW